MIRFANKRTGKSVPDSAIVSVKPSDAAKAMTAYEHERAKKKQQREARNKPPGRR